jgi:NADH-quinone oxidoreductase E subunit
MALPEATREKITALMSKYPVPRSALIPSLYLAQKETGYLPHDIIEEIAGMFHLSANEVYEIASFYTLLHKKPVGKYVVQVCTNLSCQLCDCDAIMRHLQTRLGIKPGETTPDSKFTLLEVECLASCGTSPVIQINDQYHDSLTPEKLDRILDGLT